ncbi:hypothetical protein GS682_17190 [Nostoc sp. B(2019)]|nr:hypothetical protein [Nostoc sp. B(2019)]
MSYFAVLPPWLVLDPLLRSWLLEDIGRADRTTNSLVLTTTPRLAKWVANASGIIAGLTLASRVFHLLNRATIHYVAVAR